MKRCTGLAHNHPGHWHYPTGQTQPDYCDGKVALPIKHPMDSDPFAGIDEATEGWESTRPAVGP